MDTINVPSYEHLFTFFMRSSRQPSDADCGGVTSVWTFPLLTYLVSVHTHHYLFLIRAFLPQFSATNLWRSILQANTQNMQDRMPEI